MENFFASNLKYLRIKNNLTQQQLADKLKVDRTSIGYWETGKKEPKMETVIKLAEYFDVGKDIILTNLREQSKENDTKTDIEEWNYIYSNSQNKEKLKSVMKKVSNLTDKDIDMVQNIIDTVIKSHYNNK